VETDTRLAKLLVAHEEYLQRARDARSRYVHRFAELFPELADSFAGCEEQFEHRQRQLGRVEMLQAVVPDMQVEKVLAVYAAALDVVAAQSAAVTPDQSGTRPHSKQVKIDRSRRALLDAAFQLTLAGQKLTVPEILAHAGVSRSTFYRHFSSWEELLVVAMERVLRYWGI
jgi:AraC-like DNA-binding protein